MVKGGRRKRVDRSQAVRYRTVGRALLTSAQALATVAESGDPYGNALGIVAIHAAIAYCDALSVGYGSLRSAEGDHERAVEAFQEALGAAADPDMARLLRSILNEKDTISYQGEYYTLAAATRVLGRAERFCAWAEGI
jgi:hypothetical protein